MVAVVVDVVGGATEDVEEDSGGGLDAPEALSLREKTVIAREVRGEM